MNGTKQMIPPPTLADTLLRCITADGFSIGEVSVMLRGKPCFCLDASKGDERWRIVADTRYDAVIELMEQLGWDLIDG